MPRNLQKKVKGTKRCPADYDDADQSDSDHHSDHDYNPTSPKISQAKGCHAYQLRQIDKTNKSTATPQSTKGGKTPLSPAPETSDAGKRKIARELNLQSKSPSIIWKHCTKRINENTIRCNHCETTWSGLSGSTSNPLKHLRVLHYNMLSDEEKGSLPNNGATSGNNGVRRTLSILYLFIFWS